MENPINFIQYIENSNGLLARYESYKTDDYCRFGKIFCAGGKEESLTLQSIDGDIYDRFHALCPDVRDYKMMTPNELRSLYLRNKHKMSLQVSEVSGLKMIKKFFNVDISFYLQPIKASDSEAKTKADCFSNACIGLCREFGLLTWQKDSKLIIPKDIQEYLEEYKNSEIKRWVSYGTDSKQDKRTITYQAKNIYEMFDDPKKNCILFAFDGEEIIRSLILFRLLYLFWVVEVWEEHKFEHQLELAYKAYYEFPFITNSSCHYTKDNVVKLVVDISHQYSVKRVLDLSKPEPAIISQYANPIEAAIGCMISLIGYGQGGLSGYRLVECKRCGSSFVKKGGGRRYLCSDCGTPSSRNKYLRQKKKSLEASHGKKGK